MITTITPLGCSEEQLNAWRKKGISYDKRTAKQMILAFKKAPGASSDAIKELEERLNIKLPIDYRDFIYNYDGGVPRPAAFDIKEEGNSSVVKEFFGLETPLTIASIEYNLTLYKNRIPSQFLPIGSDVFGNKIILGLEKEIFGSVFFWNHEGEAPESTNQQYRENIFLISESFSSFLNLLRPLKE